MVTEDGAILGDKDTSLLLGTGMLTVCGGATGRANTEADMDLAPSVWPRLGVTTGIAAAWGTVDKTELDSGVTSTGITGVAGVNEGGTDVTNAGISGTIGADIGSAPAFAVVGSRRIRGDSKGGTALRAAPLTALESDERGIAVGVTGVAAAILTSSMGGVAIGSEAAGTWSNRTSDSTRLKTEVVVAGTSAEAMVSLRTGPGLGITGTSADNPDVEV